MRARSEEVRGEKRDHRRVAAVVAAQIEDERVDVGEKAHHRRRGGAADRRIAEIVELDVADVARQQLGLLEAAVVVLKRARISGSTARIVREVFLRQHPRRTVDMEMHIVADGMQMLV